MINLERLINVERKRHTIIVVGEIRHPNESSISLDGLIAWLVEMFIIRWENIIRIYQNINVSRIMRESREQTFDSMIIVHKMRIEIVIKHHDRENNATNVV